jgi:N-acyl-phosphatidylethanolamine-hydrolysing phospholipase D
MFAGSPSPLKYFGPKSRWHATPCTVDELPDVDFVVVSHNQYAYLQVLFPVRGCRILKMVGKIVMTTSMRRPSRPFSSVEGVM